MSIVMICLRTIIWFQVFLFDTKNIQVDVYMCLCVCMGFVWFYGLSTSVGYLMSNPFLYI